MEMRMPTSGNSSARSRIRSDADADLGKLLREVEDPVGEVSVRRDDDAVALLVELPDDVLDVGPDEGLPSRDVGEVHRRELLDRLKGELLLGTARGLEAAAHVAARVAPVGDDDGTVELLCVHVPSHSESSTIRSRIADA